MDENYLSILNKIHAICEPLNTANLLSEQLARFEQIKFKLNQIVSSNVSMILHPAYESSLQRVSALIQNISIPKHLLESICTMNNALLQDYVNSFNIQTKALNQLTHTLTQSIVDNFSSIGSINYSQLFEGITINDDNVEITDESLEAINTLFNEATEQVSQKIELPITKRMTIKEFLLVVVYPLILIVIPMLQNSYYQKINALELQKQQMDSNVYQEQIYELNNTVSQLNNTIGSLLEYLESSQDSLKQNQDFHLPEEASEFDSLAEDPTDYLVADEPDDTDEH